MHYDFSKVYIAINITIFATFLWKVDKERERQLER